MANHWSHIATTEECCHCVLEGETQQGALSESYLLSFHIYMRRGLKDRWSQYRFPHSIFRQTLSACNLLAQFFLFHSLFFPPLSPVFHLHSALSNFCSLTLCLSLSLSFRLGMYEYSPSHSVYQKRREKKALSDPLLPFPLIPEGDWFNRYLLVRLTVASNGTSPSGCLSFMLF